MKRGNALGRCVIAKWAKVKKLTPRKPAKDKTITQSIAINQIQAKSNEYHQQFNNNFRHVCQYFFFFHVCCVFHVLITICSGAAILLMFLVKTALLVHVERPPTSARVFLVTSHPLILCCQPVKRSLCSVQAFVCIRMSVGSTLTLV